jgi:predicted transcriptional regulator
MRKARKICDMRLQGKTFRVIAEEVGLSTDRVRQYVSRVQRKYDSKLKREEFEERKKENKNELNNVFKLIEIEYDNAKRCKHIKKPLAYAIYEVWQRVDRKEKERNVN